MRGMRDVRQVNMMSYSVFDSSCHPLIPTLARQVIFYMESVQYSLKLEIPSKARYLVPDLDDILEESARVQQTDRPAAPSFA